jgi:hypothetical protein
MAPSALVVSTPLLLDVHATSCTAAVIDAQGKKLRSYVIETNGQALVEFFQAQPGAMHVCLGEGTQSEWLVEILSPDVERIVLPRSPGQVVKPYATFLFS